MLSFYQQAKPGWYALGGAAVVVTLGAFGGYSLFYRYQRGVTQASAAERVSARLKSRQASSPSALFDISSSDSVFEVTQANGFLPSQPIPTRLPDAYGALETVGINFSTACFATIFEREWVVCVAEISYVPYRHTIIQSLCFLLACDDFCS
jgi:hypothetical protein